MSAESQEDEPIPSPEPQTLVAEPAAVEDDLTAEIAALEAEGDEAAPPRTLECYAITPLYDRVLVKREEAPEALRGIVQADAYKQKPQRGIVIAIGDGRIVPGFSSFVALRVQPGDRVLFGMYAGVEVELDSDGRETALVLREDEIIAVVETMGAPHAAPGDVLPFESADVPRAAVGEPEPPVPTEQEIAAQDAARKAAFTEE